MTIATRVRMARRPLNPLTRLTPLHGVWAGDPLWSNPGGGNPVASWRNQSGGGDPAQGTGAAQPLWYASITELGNRAAVVFDGTDDCLTFDTADTAQVFKGIVVGRYTSNPSAAINMLGFGAGLGEGVGLNASNRVYLSNGTTLQVGSGSLGTAGHVWRFTCNGASSAVWQDGTSILTGNSGADSLTRLKLGCGGSGASNSRFAPVQIAFWGIYSSTTDDTALAVLAADLKTHYGL